MSKKYFTVDEANGLIPALKQELHELRKLQSHFDQKLHRLNKIKMLNKNQVQTQTDRVFMMESGLDFLEMQAQLHLKNIENTGVQLKGIDPGLIDFPSLKDDDEILLCWKEGETEITHYHGVHDGFAGRKPLNE